MHHILVTTYFYTIRNKGTSVHWHHRVIQKRPRLQICGEDESAEAIILSVCISTKSRNSNNSNTTKTMYVSGESVKGSQILN